ncbi:MAG: TolC family protein [Lachnospiraceae bacterium]|nr:TolC family protein [Lachnospiraceae bacterium]
MKRRIRTILISAVLALSMSISTFASELTDSFLLSVPKDESASELTLETAIEKAISKSSAIKKINLSLSSSDSDRQTLVNEYYASTTDNNISTALALLKYDMSYSSTLRSKEVQEEQIAYSMTSTFMEIIKAQRSLEVKKKAIETASKEMAVNKLKEQLGMISQTELSKLTLTYEDNKTDYEDLEKSLSDAFKDLNTLIGESEDSYTIAVLPVYEKLTLETALDTYISTKMSTDPDILDSTDSLYIAELNEDLYDGTSGSYSSVTTSLSQATLSLSDLKESYTSKLESLYDSIISDEKTYEANLKEYELLKTNLTIAEKKYELGMITKIELENARNSVYSEESSLLSNIYEHMLLLEKFESPYLG